MTAKSGDQARGIAGETRGGRTIVVQQLQDANGEGQSRLEMRWLHPTKKATGRASDDLEDGWWS